MQEQLPLPPTPPAPPTVPIPVIAGQPVVGSPQDVYQAYRAQRKELGRQMDDLEERRSDLSRQLREGSLEGADKAGVEQRLRDVDGRITTLDKAIADADAQVARAAAIPGAAVDPPAPPREGPPEEVFVLAGMFIFVVLFPLTIAYARRLWRRGAAVATTLPKELMDRLMGLEQSVGAIAEEVERIGEGQRFMTRAFNEQGAAALAAGAVGAAEPIEVRAAQGANVRR